MAKETYEAKMARLRAKAHLPEPPVVSPPAESVAAVQSDIEQPRRKPIRKPRAHRNAPIPFSRGGLPIIFVR